MILVTTALLRNMCFYSRARISNRIREMDSSTYTRASRHPHYIDFQYRLAYAYAQYFRYLERDVAVAHCSKCRHIHSGGLFQKTCNIDHTCELITKEERYRFYEQHNNAFISLVDENEVTSLFVTNYKKDGFYKKIPAFFGHIKNRYILFGYKHFIQWICTLISEDFREHSVKPMVDYFRQQHLKFIQAPPTGQAYSL